MPSPKDLPASYYEFDNYNTKIRMLTYWYQIREVVGMRPRSVLEVGVGSGMVSAYLRQLGIAVTTLDVNPKLEADITGSVLDLSAFFEPASFDAVLCARVLHHLPVDSFDAALEQLAWVTRDGTVVTLPVEEARVYASARVTGGRLHTASVPIPLSLKRAAISVLDRVRGGSGFTYGCWKVGGRPGLPLEQVLDAVRARFSVVRAYRLPEDQAHLMLVLSGPGR